MYEGHSSQCALCFCSMSSCVCLSFSSKPRRLRQTSNTQMSWYPGLGKGVGSSNENKTIKTGSDSFQEIAEAYSRPAFYWPLVTDGYIWAPFCAWVETGSTTGSSSAEELDPCSAICHWKEQKVRQGLLKKIAGWRWALDLLVYGVHANQQATIMTRGTGPSLTFVIGPETLGRCWLELPETEASGLGPLKDGLDLNGVMLWETPAAKVNCSRSSTLVRPLAVWAEREMNTC